MGVTLLLTVPCQPLTMISALKARLGSWPNVWPLATLFAAAALGTSLLAPLPATVWIAALTGIASLLAWRCGKTGADLAEAWLLLAAAAALILLVVVETSRDLAAASLLLTALAATKTPGQHGQRGIAILLVIAAAYGGWLTIETLSAGALPAGEPIRAMILALGLALVGSQSNQVQTLEQRVERRSNHLSRASFRVVRLAQRDGLTGTYNRRFLLESLQREKARADEHRTPFSICLLSLDRFKSINDQYGHDLGDQVLREFAEHLRALIRTADWISPGRVLGRYDGSEFLVILPATPMAGAKKVAERLRQSVQDSPFCGDLKLTLSAGVAQFRIGEPLAEVLKEADRALHLAKQMGRNRVETGIVKEPKAPTRADVIPLRPRRFWS